LPDDTPATIYFDNEFGVQSQSPAIVASYKSFAEAYAARAVQSSGLVSRVGGCTAASASDQNCFNAFASRAIRRTLRRLPASGEIARYATVLIPYSVQDARFTSGIELLITALVQHPEFLFRVEKDAVVLNAFEIASRIAFFTTGATPDDTLLTAAENGDLVNENARATQASRLMNTAQARRHWSRFHGQWLGFGTVALSSPLANDMRQESSKLVERVIFDLNRDWLEILTWDETYLTPALAQHYGMGALTAPAWVKYGNTRAGIISHASFLALGGKFGDTSPTLRGYEVFKRVLCGKLGTIPPGVDTDIAPGVTGQCKPQRYYMRTVSSCAGCHNITDGIGFGMENLDANGLWRGSEPGNPNCSISGQGDVKGKTFNGAKELAQLLKDEPGVAVCASKQLFRFLAGRDDTSADALAIRAIELSYLQNRSFKDLIVELMKSPMITFGKGV
jgi:hypothetical protein